MPARYHRSCRLFKQIPFSIDLLFSFDHDSVCFIIYSLIWKIVPAGHHRSCGFFEQIPFTFNLLFTFDHHPIASIVYFLVRETMPSCFHNSLFIKVIPFSINFLLPYYFLSIFIIISISFAICPPFTFTYP